MLLSSVLSVLLSTVGVVGGADGPTAVFVNMDTVWQALEIMGKGMLGIFVVMVLIALIVVVLTRLGAPKK